MRCYLTLSHATIRCPPACTGGKFSSGRSTDVSGCFNDGFICVLQVALVLSVLPTFMSLGHRGLLGPFPFLSMNFFRSVLRYSNTCSIGQSACLQSICSTELKPHRNYAVTSECHAGGDYGLLHALWSANLEMLSLAYQVQYRLLVLLHMLYTEQSALTQFQCHVPGRH